MRSLRRTCSENVLGFSILTSSLALHYWWIFNRALRCFLPVSFRKIRATWLEISRMGDRNSVILAFLCLLFLIFFALFIPKSLKSLRNGRITNEGIMKWGRPRDAASFRRNTIFFKAMHENERFQIDARKAYFSFATEMKVLRKNEETLFSLYTVSRSSDLKNEIMKNQKTSKLWNWHLRVKNADKYRKSFRTNLQQLLLSFYFSNRSINSRVFKLLSTFRLGCKIVHCFLEWRIKNRGIIN